MKGVTRKERIINAMLEGDASACCGVSREERNLAKVAKATCDGQLGGGSGGGWDAVIRLNKNPGYLGDNEPLSLESGTFESIHKKIADGEPVNIIFKMVYGDEDNYGTWIDYCTISHISAYVRSVEDDAEVVDSLRLSVKLTANDGCEGYIDWNADSVVWLGKV